MYESKPSHLSSMATARSEENVLYVPVVFHIVYSENDQNVSDDQIHSQMQVINEDFGMTNANAMDTRNEFESVAANVGIQFYVAEVNDEEGITRTATSHGPFFNDDLHVTSLGGEDAWDTHKYLNVWIADLASGIFGYGSAPGSPEFKDGVAVHFEYFGRDTQSSSPYHLGRTLTHEIGHWLGLQHPWGTSGECMTDDGLTDTPAQSGPTFGCQLDQTSCGTLNMVQNFMNTSYDQCMTLFTIQQKELMRQVLTTQRSEVYNDVPPVITAVDELSNKITALVYPNPVVQHTFYIHFSEVPSRDVNVSLIDLLGRIAGHWRITPIGKECAIDTQGLSNGIYVARIEEREWMYSQKIYLNIN
jgi:hypothetical protein